MMDWQIQACEDLSFNAVTITSQPTNHIKNRASRKQAKAVGPGSYCTAAGRCKAQARPKDATDYSVQLDSSTSSMLFIEMAGISDHGPLPYRANADT